MEAVGADSFDGVAILVANELKDILKFYYGTRLEGLSTMKKAFLSLKSQTHYMLQETGQKHVT